MKILKSYLSKKILITGGAGFIGSNLCKFFLNHGFNVKCLDNLSTGNFKNIEPFLDNELFSFVKGDIRDLKTCVNACKNISFVFHQAALGSVPRSIEDPISSNEVNISGFLNILIACNQNNIERLIYASSSSTYGNSVSLPKIESKIGLQKSPYAITKYVNELYAQNFKELYNLDSIGLRYFNVFGPNQNPDGSYAAVIPRFILKLINKENLTINGDGSFSRDFTYIDNVINMNVLSMITKDKKSINQVYNVAVGESLTILGLANFLKKEIAKYDSDIAKIKFNYGPERYGDIEHSIASIEKSKKLLGYAPTCKIEKGLLKTIDWFWKKYSKL